MKYLVIFLILFALAFPLSAHAFETSSDFTLATANWEQASYSSNAGTHVAVTVTDPDANMHSEVIDYIWTTIHSDSDPDLTGTKMTLFETGFDTGVFEMEIVFSDSPPSGQGFLHVSNGDTIHVKYLDTTVPANYILIKHMHKETENGIEVHASAVTGLWGPPMVRAPAANPRIVDLFGNSIDSPAVGEQIQITSDIANGRDREQKFAYLVLIQDDTDTAVSLSWIDGILNPESSFSPSASWIPQKAGYYVATMFVWESIDNPTALSPPIQIDFTVISEYEQNTRQPENKNHQETFMFIIPQDKFGQFTDVNLRTLYYYKMNHQELSSLPRLSMLVNMTEDFPFQPVSKLALRITDDQIAQYDLFFEQKCKEQRPYAADEDCMQTDFAFEYDEKWYYTYVKLASSKDAIEDSTNSWDPEYFTRK